jgi:hypothetical protein
MSHQRPAFHECKLHWWFTEHGLSPYWALAMLMHAFPDGWHEFDLELGDGVWHVRFTYNADTGIAPRPQDDIDGETAYEFKIHLDGPGEKKADFNFSPRWDDQRKPDGEPMSRPWCGGEGLDVHVQGSNLTFDEYHYLLQTTAAALAAEAGVDWNPRYFNQPRGDSNITTLERYYRLKREYATKLTRSTGAFYGLMHLLAGEEGTEWVYSGDNSQIVGHRHAFDLSPGAAAELAPAHSLGKRLKCYHPKYARQSESSDDPLSSPKFGVAFHSSLNDSDGFGDDYRSHGTAVEWRDRDQLVRELDETLVNVCDWAGIPVTDQTVFVDDDHFEAGADAERDAARFDDPTPQLEADQENAVTRVLQEVSPSADAIMRRLATDGGHPDSEGVHYTTLADDTGYSVSQVYRALEEIDDVIETDNGLVRFYSQKIREEITAVVQRVEDLVGEGIEAVARLAGAGQRAVEDSALQRWMDRFGVEFDLDDETIRIDTLLSEIKSGPGAEVSHVLQRGLDAWTAAGRDPLAFVECEFAAEFVDRGGSSWPIRGEKITW